MAIDPEELPGGEIPMRAQADNQPPPDNTIVPPFTFVPTMARMFQADEDWDSTVVPKPRPRHHVAGAELWLYNDTGVLVRGFNTFTLSNPTTIEISSSGDVLSAWYLEQTSRPATPAERELWREAVSRDNDYRHAMKTVTETLQFIAAAIGTLSGAPGAHSLDSPAGASTETLND